MALKTREDMEAIIAAGNPVVFAGKIYFTEESLPSQLEIDAVYEVAVGKSAYDLAIDNGFVGTESEWLATLVGEQGEQGETGAQGEQGPAGEGSGNVNGPVSSTDNNIAVFDGTTGTLIKDGGATVASKQDALGFTPVPNTRTVNTKALSSNITLNPDDLSDAATTNKFVTAAEKTKLSNLSGTNTGDQDLSGKANIASPTFTGTVGGITKSMVGLGNVDNVADASKAFAATQLTSGTLPDARFPSVLPAISGANLTNLPTSGADIQTFTGNGTWTKPSGATTVMVICIGSGGGGAGGGSTHGGGGGGGGAARYAFFMASQLGSTEIVVVGAAGSAGATNANGGAGNPSSFGTDKVKAWGGGAGVANAASTGGGGGWDSAGSAGTGGGPVYQSASNQFRWGGWGGTENNAAETNSHGEYGGGGGGRGGAGFHGRDGAGSKYGGGGGGGGAGNGAFTGGKRGLVGVDYYLIGNAGSGTGTAGSAGPFLAGSGGDGGNPSTNGQAGSVGGGGGGGGYTGTSGGAGGAGKVVVVSWK